MLNFIYELKNRIVAQGERKTFLINALGSAGIRLGYKLYRAGRAQGLPLEWGIVITGNSDEEKFLAERGIPPERIVKILDEGAGRDIDLACEKLEEKRTEIIEKIKRFTNQPNSKNLILGGYAGGVSGACCRKRIIEDFAQYSRAESILYFAVASHEDADDLVMKNEAGEFDSLMFRASHDPYFEKISVFILKNRFSDYHYCNEVAVNEAILPLLRFLLRGDFSGEQRIKAKYMTGVVGTVATAEEVGVKSDKQSLKRLVEYAARNNFIDAPDPSGIFNSVIAVIQLPPAKITDTARRIIREETANKFGIPEKSVVVFGAPEEHTSVVRLVLLCLGINDSSKYRASGLYKMLEKSRNIEVESVDEWKRRTRTSFFNANHVSGKHESEGGNDPSEEG